MQGFFFFFENNSMHQPFDLVCGSSTFVTLIFLLLLPLLKTKQKSFFQKKIENGLSVSSVFNEFFFFT